MTQLTFLKASENNISVIQLPRYGNIKSERRFSLFHKATFATSVYYTVYNVYYLDFHYTIYVFLYISQIYTHVYKAILAQLTEKAKKSECREPCQPQDNLVHVLNVKYTKYKDEFVKQKVSNFILEMLILGNSKFAKYKLLNGLRQQSQRTIDHVHHRLKH